jgi:hypothetical protein
MAEAPRLHSEVARYHARWLWAQTLLQGGRWAMVPVALIALIAIGLEVAGQARLPLLIPLCVLGMASWAGCLVLARLENARSRSKGAPDPSLLMDRELGLRDALATWHEAPAGFKQAIERQLERRWDAAAARRVRPPLRLSGALASLLLALLPLALWEPLRNPPPKDSDANDRAAGSRADGAEARDEASPAAGKGDKPEPGDRGEGAGSGGQGGEQPEGGEKTAPKGEESGPKGEKPAPKDANPRPQPGDAPPNPGDAPQPRDVEAPKPKDPKLENRDLEVKPDVGEGARRAEERKRWIYNPEGERRAGEGSGETGWRREAEGRLPRLRVSGGERRFLETWLRSLGD